MSKGLINKIFNRNNEGPPGLDEIFEKFFDKLSNKKKNSSDDFNGSNNGYNQGTPGRNVGFNLPSTKKLVSLILFVMLVIWLLLGLNIINQQERGVVLRLGKFNEVIEPGLRWRPFYIDKVYSVNVTRLRDLRSQGQMLTEDENIIQVTVNIQYNIRDPRDFILNVYQPTISLRHAFESSVRHVVGSSKMNRILTDGRADAAVEIAERLQSYLDRYNIGINIVTANVENTQAPGELQNAFDDVIKAREDNQKFQNQAIAYANEIVPISRGIAKRMLEGSKAYKSKVVSEAQGNANRFTDLLAEYIKAPEVTRKRIYLETLEKIFANTNKVLVSVKGANNLLYLPLDKIVKKYDNVQIIDNDQLTLTRNNAETGRNSILTKNN